MVYRIKRLGVYQDPIATGERYRSIEKLRRVDRCLMFAQTENGRFRELRVEEHVQGEYGYFFNAFVSGKRNCTYARNSEPI